MEPCRGALEHAHRTRAVGMGAHRTATNWFGTSRPGHLTLSGGMGGRSLLPRGPRAPLADLHLPVGRALTPRTKRWLGEEVDALLSPQPRSNKGVIDDLSSASVPRPRRGTQMQYESSVFSPPGAPVTPRRQGLKQVLGSSNASELREILRSPRMDQGQGVDDEMHFKRRKAGKRVLASYDAMKQVVQKLDTSRTGAITARDLNNALDKLGIKMRRDDFRRLAEDVDPGSQGNAATHLPALARVPEEPARRRGERRLTPGGLGGGRRDGHGDQRKKADLSGSWRKMLEMKVARHWKQLQRDFKRLDPQRSGLVEMHNLITALEVYGVTLETEDADALYLQLGVGRTGKINWGEFLKYFSGALSRPGAISAPPDMVANKQGGTHHRGHADHVSKDIDGYMRSICSQWRAIRQACQIMDKGLSKVLTKHHFKGILFKLGASAPDLVLEAVCHRYRQEQRPDGYSIVLSLGDGKDSGDMVGYNHFIKDLARLFPTA